MTVLAPTFAERLETRPDFVGRSARWIAERRRAHLKRRAFATLLNVDDDILKDVSGLDRRQVERLAALPVERDALAAARAMQERRLN